MLGVRHFPHGLLCLVLLASCLSLAVACGGGSSTDESTSQPGSIAGSGLTGGLPVEAEDGETLSGTRGPTQAALHHTGWVVVPLQPLDPNGVPPGLEVIQAHELTPEGDNWQLDAPGSRLVRTRDKPAIELGAGRVDQLLVAELRGQFDARAINRVVVTGRFEGTGWLVATVLRDGEALLSSEPLGLPNQDDLSEFVLDMHKPDGLLANDSLLGDGLLGDTLRIECGGGYRRLVLTSVELQRATASSDLPDPRGAPRWVTVRESARLAVGLHQDLPLVGEVDVPANGFLDLSLAAADEAGGVRLIVSDGARQERHGLGVPASGSGWTDITVPLSSWAGRHVTIELHWDRPTGAMVGPLFVGAADDAAPTMVLITSGSHRGDHLGLAFRGIDIDTPVLDALAGRGVLFTDAQGVTNAPRPALASLLTGRTPRDTGLLDESDMLSAAAPTLAERLSAVGWRCEAVLATRALWPESSGLGQGFDHVEAPLNSWRWAADEVVARARQRLESHDGRPLFLWLHVAEGEWPHEPDEQVLARYYRPTDDPLHEGYKRPKVFKKSMPLPYLEVRDLNWARARYKASLTALDSALGPLLDEPRVQGGTVAFVGSQGLGLGEHSIWFKHVGLYPSVLHVPLIVAAGDGSWPRGLRCDEPVSTLGLAATLATAVGADPEGWQGEDLRAVARGEVHPGPRFAVEDHAQSAAVTSNGLHLIVSLQPRNSAHLVERRKLGELELYDLTNDWKAEVTVPMEGTEAEGKPLGLLLLRWLSEAEDLDWAEPGVLDNARRAHLEELGYTGTPPRTPENPWSIDH